MPSPLWPELLRQAPLMQFYRFCELLERSAPQLPPLGSTDSPANEPLRFRSRGALGFPTREIDAVQIDPDDAQSPATLRTTFMGLYGVDARVPSYFVDEIAQNREGAEPLAAFLDIFQHRLVTQYYRIWRKYRYPVGFVQDGSDAVSSYLLGLAGFVQGARPPGGALEPRKLLSMLGLVSQKTRTAEGLSGILLHAVPDATIVVEEFHPQWVGVHPAQRATLLGEDCVLGGGFYDRSACIRVILTPGSAAVVSGLLPGQPMHGNVIELLRIYVGYETQVVLEMLVQPSLLPRPILDAGGPNLGCTSLLTPQQPRAGDNAPLIRIRLATWRRAATD
jgi:type VI secretion system protein ImpH